MFNSFPFYRSQIKIKTILEAINISESVYSKLKCQFIQVFRVLGEEPLDILLRHEVLREHSVLETRSLDSSFSIGFLCLIEEELS